MRPGAPRGKIVGSRVEHRVLVTGCPRSGTTFVGTALSLPATVDYLHEPLNPDCGLPSVPHRFVDLCRPTMAATRDELARLFAYEPLLRGEVYARDSRARRWSKRVVRGRGPLHLAAGRVNPFSKHQVIKDPYAALSVRWFLDQRIPTIAVVRHPAAVAASYARLGWSASNSVERLHERGAVSADEAALVDEARGDDLAAVAVLWRVLVRRLVELEGDDDFRLVTHESVSERPADRLAELREEFGLPWTRTADARLRRLTSGPAVGTRRAQQLHRRSGEIFTRSLQHLDRDQLHTVWRIAEPVATRWYEIDAVRARR